MQYKIGIFGSAIQEHPDAISKTKEIGFLLAQQNIIIITGACTGMPYIAAKEAAKYGTTIWGYSPNMTKQEQLAMYPDDDISIYSTIYYIPHIFKELFFAQSNPQFSEDSARKKYRNVISTANCDAGIIISGRWGTLNEFTNLLDMGKVIGVLEGTGGIADELKLLTGKITKKTSADVYFDHSPKKLITQLISTLEKRSPFPKS